MTNEEIGWDDLDKDTPPTTPTDDLSGDPDIEIATIDENGDPIIPDAGLTNTLPDDDDDVDPDKALVTPPGPPDPDPDPDADPKKTDDPAKTDTADQSGIEQYLSQFDIEGGMISFEDGTSKHFDELEAAKQAEVLQQLHGNQTTSVEDRYGLVEDEIGLLNYLRENKLSVQEMVETMATERVQTLMAVQQSNNTDYDTMSDEAVYSKFLQEANSEDTPEQIETKLQEAKGLSTFSNVTAALRNQYKTVQTTTAKAATDASIKENADVLESQRKTVVEAVRSINDIAGVELNDNIKNSVLDRVLEVDSKGESLFMGEVFADPTKLFKAAFWYYYGDGVSKQRDEYWKKEKSAAYKRGKSDALGTSQPGISFTSGKNKPVSPVVPPAGGNQYDFDD